MVRNSEGKIVDQSGVEVFKSEVFKGLSSVDNLVQVCPNTTFLDKQTQAAYVAFPDECRKLIEYHSSKAIDDNFSLASVEGKGEKYYDDAKHTAYINNTMCLLALVNKIASLESEQTRNDILGGTFPTKNDDSEDSMIPMYLCVEILKAKCTKDAATPVNSLENYDVTGKTELPKNSTLSQEFDKVIEKLKQLNYDKSYFGSNANMSDTAINYLSACQRDPSGTVDIYAKRGEDNCELYVTQGATNVNSVVMFTVEKKAEATPEIAVPSATPNIEIPAIEQPVIPSVNNEATPVNNSEPSENNNKDEVYKKKLEVIKQKREELEKLRDQANKAEEALIAAQNDAYEELASMFKGHVSQTKTVNPEVSANAAMFK